MGSYAGTDVVVVQRPLNFPKQLEFHRCFQFFVGHVITPSRIPVQRSGSSHHSLPQDHISYTEWLQEVPVALQPCGV
jgi:hypothetical protein